MKKFFLHFSGAVLVGLALAIGLYFLVPNWTRSDMISVFSLVIAMWAAGSTRWASIPQGQPVRKSQGKPIHYEGGNKNGSVHFTLERKSSTAFELSARNIGNTEIRDVSFKTTPFGNRPMPSFTQARDKAVPLLKPHEKVLIGHGTYDRATGISFDIEAVWKDPDGRSQKRKRTMTYK
jgi:hypothetical protein